MSRGEEHGGETYVWAHEGQGGGGGAGRHVGIGRAREVREVSKGSGKTDLRMVLTAASLLRMQLVGKISLLACQHSHLLLHALHLIADVCCAPLQPAV